MSAGHEVDPRSLPSTEAERRRLAQEIAAKARASLGRRELLAASLHAADALCLFPNDRELLDLFDTVTEGTPDPLALFPIATGAVHVATAAGRARVLMTQRRLSEAVELLGKVFQAAPELEYLDWVRRWIVAAPSIPRELGWNRWLEAVVGPALRLAIAAPVPTPEEHPRLPNIRAAAEIFSALLPAYPEEKLLYYGTSVLRRRLGDTAATLQAAEEGVRRFPNDWGMRTALLNALRDARRPDEALHHARRALELDRDDLSPLYDAAWGFLDAERPGDAAALFQELLQREPQHPSALPCLQFARFKATGNEDDRRALLAARDRMPWDDVVVDLADTIDPPLPFMTVLPGPGDASASYGRMVVRELSQVMRCCGRGARVEVTIQSRFPESPTIPIAFDFALRSVGAGGARMNVEVERFQSPDPRADKGQVSFPILGWQGQWLAPTYTQADPRAQHAVGTVAYQLFRRDVWDPAAQQIAAQAGPGAVQAFLSVLMNPPLPPPEHDGMLWMYRCQIATAVILSHMGPWGSGPSRSALFSLVCGPSDWLTIAGIVALGFRAWDNPSVRADVEGTFRWLRGQIAAEGFTPWEYALANTWLGLGSHPEPVKAELEAWIAQYEKTITSKNSVRTLRRYGGMTIEEYARFSEERDRLMSGLAYQGPMGAMQNAFSPSRELSALCNQVGLSPQYPFVTEWQEALNANPHLMEQFIEEKQRQAFERMGVSKEEKAAFDEIRSGNMDMHQRMAQAQQAQSAMSDGSAGDPDPVVFPGQPVARLSDYVRILKGMQTGNMAGALAPYGLDIMGYSAVAQAWGAKMAADPVLTEKFSRMMK